MKKIKALLLGAIIGLLLGLWIGVNIGKDKPVFSNPFAEDSIQEKLKKSGGRLLEKSGEALEKGGKALQQKMDDSAK